VTRFESKMATKRLQIAQGAGCLVSRGLLVEVDFCLNDYDTPDASLCG
jgi:hypothetical protein